MTMIEPRKDIWPVVSVSIASASIVCEIQPQTLAKNLVLRKSWCSLSTETMC